MSKYLEHIDLELLKDRLRMGCDWLADIAQLKTEEDSSAEKKHHQLSWKGAIKGEYNAADKKWSFFCPIWHSGQAVKALIRGHQILGGEKFLDAARLSAQFIANNQVMDKDDDEFGLIYACEDFFDKVNTAAVLECLDGLIELTTFDDSKDYWPNIIAAAQWCARKAYNGNGLLHDFYDFKEKTFLERSGHNKDGRPLIDDSVFLKVYKKNKDEAFRKIFFEIAERLLSEEYPSGNWIKYGPSNPDVGFIHPRHAYWWGLPMLDAYVESGEVKYLECAKRAAEWYKKAQRKDGGLFRKTYIDFSSESFGHATSGIACAMVLWKKLDKLTGQNDCADAYNMAAKFCLDMQFVNPTDPNLKGAVLEKILPPDGTDRSPYYVRALGTIFFIQGISEALIASEELCC